MKKQLCSISHLASLAVLCAVISWDAPYAQQTSPDAQQPPSQTQPNAQAPPAPPSKQPPNRTSPDTQAPPSDATGTQIFTGTVVQQGNRYVLQGDNGVTYDIDLQDEVKKFEGKHVRVHGTLDPSGKMIHVQ